MKTLIVTILALVLLQGCTRPDNARSVLTNAGYTSIQLNGHAWFLCDEKDTFADEFTATAPNGHVVTGAVCSGVFKGSTIRFD